MDKAPFDAIKFTGTVLKESTNIKLSLEAVPLKLDEFLLDPIPCPRIKYTESSEAADASIEQLSIWSQQLLQLEKSLGIIKFAKPRGLDTTKLNKILLQRSESIPQLNQNKTKLPRETKIPETPKNVDIELTKQMLSEYCKKCSASRSSSTIEIDKALINGVCSGLDALKHLIADITVEYAKQPIVEAITGNEDLSDWLNDINQAITNINILEASNNMYAVDKVKIQDNHLRECLVNLAHIWISK